VITHKFDAGFSTPFPLTAEHAENAEKGFFRFSLRSLLASSA
jgi:hypothetical protein